MPMRREAKTAWQRQRRAQAAIDAGREPHVTGRPATGRQAPKCHGDRAGQRARARLRFIVRNGDNGTVSGHPIMDEAFRVARRYAKPDRGRVIFDPLFEEAVCVAALAICAGQDPDVATAAYVRAERDWSRRTAPLWLA